MGGPRGGVTRRRSHQTEHSQCIPACRKKLSCSVRVCRTRSCKHGGQSRGTRARPSFNLSLRRQTEAACLPDDTTPPQDPASRASGARRSSHDGLQSILRGCVFLGIHLRREHLSWRKKDLGVCRHIPDCGPDLADIVVVEQTRDRDVPPCLRTYLPRGGL